MADDISLLQEVDEALRADKLEQFWARYSGALITFCVLAVLASAASVLWKNHQQDLHEKQTSLLVKAYRLTGDGKYGEAIGFYEKAEAQGGTLGAMADLRRAEALIFMKQEDKALGIYNALAEKGDTPAPFRDYAKLEADILTHNAAIKAGKAVPASGSEATLGKTTFRYSVGELDALRLLKEGNIKAATALLSTMLADEAAPYSTRARAAILLETLKEPKEAKK